MLCWAEVECFQLHVPLFARSLGACGMHCSFLVHVLVTKVPVGVAQDLVAFMGLARWEESLE